MCHDIARRVAALATERVVVRGAFPAVIDRLTFDAVQALLRSKAPAIVHPRRVSSPYLLSGLLKCGKCDGAMMGHGRNRGNIAITSVLPRIEAVGACVLQAQSPRW